MKIKFSILTAIVTCSNFAVQLPRYATECYYENLQHGDRLEISFEVMSSTLGEYEIDFQITNPDGSMLHTVDRHREAAFGFYAGATGQHDMCFFNKKSASDKVVSFSFLGPDDQATVQAPKDASDEEQQLGKDIQSLSNDLRFMKDELAYLNKRIIRHASTANSTYSRIFWWSLVQVALLMGVVYFQITYLRGFFEKRRLV